MAEEGGPREGKSQMISGDLAHVRRWGTGMRGAISQQRMSSISRTGGVFLRWHKGFALMHLPFCISHFTSPGSAGVQVRAKQVPHGWLDISTVPLAQETLGHGRGEHAGEALLPVQPHTFPLGNCFGQLLETGYWDRRVFGLSQGGCFHAVFC